MLIYDYFHLIFMKMFFAPSRVRTKKVDRASWGEENIESAGVKTSFLLSERCKKNLLLQYLEKALMKTPTSTASLCESIKTGPSPNFVTDNH